MRIGGVGHDVARERKAYLRAKAQFIADIECQGDPKLKHRVSLAYLETKTKRHAKTNGDANDEIDLGPDYCTVRETVPVCVMAPEVPVTVMV